MFVCIEIKFKYLFIFEIHWKCLQSENEGNCVTKKTI